MTANGEPVEDLIARARRGEVSPAERRRLEVALHTSLEARLLYEAGLAFDREASLRPGDEALVERIASRVVGAPRRRLLPSWIAAAAVLTSAAAAVAAWTVVGTAPAAVHSLAPAGVVRAGSSIVNRARLTSAAPGRLTDEQQKAPFPAEARAAAERLGAPASERAARPATKPEAQAETPAALFKRANLARREGHLVEALQAYERLQRQFPDSNEAVFSHLTVAELQLRRGNPGSALREYRAYEAAGGDLTDEALWGQAKAFRALGRTGEEREVLKRLLERVPKSVYSGSAQQRLNATER